MWPDGSFYEGSYEFGVKNGYGKFMWADRSMYEGHFQENRMNGHGNGYQILEYN